MNNAKMEFIRTPEQFTKLANFGAEFKHGISVKENVQYVALVVAGEWIGYAQVINVPTVLFAWNPEKCAKHRHGMIDACKKFAGWAKIRFGIGLTAVNHDVSAFTPEIMEKLGMHDTGHKLYSTRN